MNMNPHRLRLQLPLHLQKQLQKQQQQWKRHNWNSFSSTGMIVIAKTKNLPNRHHHHHQWRRRRKDYHRDCDSHFHPHHHDRRYYYYYYSSSMTRSFSSSLDDEQKSSSQSQSSQSNNNHNAQQSTQSKSQQSQSSQSSKSSILWNHDDSTTTCTTTTTYADFFGEPVTFFKTRHVAHHSNNMRDDDSSSNNHTHSLQKQLSQQDQEPEQEPFWLRAMAAFNAHLLTVVSKGQTAIGGGEEDGHVQQAAHASALSWAEVLRFAAVYNNNNNHHHHNHTTNHNRKNHPSDSDTSTDTDTHESPTNNSRSTRILEEENEAKVVSNSTTPTPADADAVAMHSTSTCTVCPMLAVVAVAPVLAQCGMSYMRHIDATLIAPTRSAAPGLPRISLLSIARAAAVTTTTITTTTITTTTTTDPNDPHDDHPQNHHHHFREHMHVRALQYLLNEQPWSALNIYLQLLRQCPGDVLAMSLIVDLSHKRLGDAHAAAALRMAGTVASYWEERQGGSLFTPSIPGQSLAQSYMAVGFAAGGQRIDHAEYLVQRIQGTFKYRTQLPHLCGGISTWALSLIYDHAGRIAEGISATANFDGMRLYEACGFLFFDTHLAGYGSRFHLDREERGRGTSRALRLYDEHFRRILEYSGFTMGRPWTQPQQRAPVSWTQLSSSSLSSSPTPSLHSSSSSETANRLLSPVAGNAENVQERSWWSRFFGGSINDYTITYKESNKSDEGSFEIVSMDNHRNALSRGEQWDPTLEDALTWLPPTLGLLSDATLLLLRFTLNGTIARSNERWKELRLAWESWFKILQKQQQQANQCSTEDDHPEDDYVRTDYTFRDVSDWVAITASLVLPPSDTGADQIGSGRFALGLYLLGEQLALGELPPEDSSSSSSPSLTGTKAEGEEHPPQTISTPKPSLLERTFFVADREPDFWLPAALSSDKDGDHHSDDHAAHAWKTIVQHLATAIDGEDETDDQPSDGNGIRGDSRNDASSSASSTIPSLAWTFDGRPILEHAIVYSCCKAGDVPSLCLARSICSQGVTLRPNSPEEWWRYSIVLGLLGDQVASEDALTNSIRMGAGQGSRKT